MKEYRITLLLDDSALNRVRCVVTVDQGLHRLEGDIVYGDTEAEALDAGMRVAREAI